jgi:centrosomal CEP192-like protein/beta-propeller repeat-containing protein/ASPM-SPD-2-Hydin domain-containing protein
MAKRGLLFLLPALFLLSGHSLDLKAAEVDPGKLFLPLIFENNVGQAASPYQFVSRHGEIESLFSEDGVDLVVGDGATVRAQIHFRLNGARAHVIPQGRGPLPSVTNYLIGNDPSRWISGVPNQSQVIFSQIYSGIDLVFHGKGNQMEQDFRVAARGNPDLVCFSIEGAKGVALDALGNLEISIANEKLVIHKPVAYQELSHLHEAVESSFVLNPDGSVQFHLGKYDRARELVIDPVFSFSTYLAGSSADDPTAVTTDSSGNVYVTGFTNSLDFPIVNGLQPTYSGSPDAFVSKLDPTGHTLLYSTYLGGTSRNYGSAIAVDVHGNIIVAGTSSSNDFPHVGAVPPLTCGGNNDCFFIASLRPDGTAFNYSGLIGGIEGTAVQSGNGGSGVLALDSSGNAYLASVTDDANFELTPGTLAKSVPGYPYNSTFVLKVANTGALSYSTIVPGVAPSDLNIYLNNVFIPSGISVDANGQATIAGTSGPGLPSTAGVVQATFPNGNSGNASAGFVLKLNAKASAINYATYIPGTDTVGGLAIDSKGDSYVTGGTSEPNLPVSSNAYQKTLKVGVNCTCNSGFLLKLNGTGTAILAATYLEGTPTPGNAGTAFSGIALDSHSNVFVGGMTGSTDFPLVDPFVSEWIYGESVGDMVMAEMNPDLSSLLFGSFLSSTDQLFPASTFAAVTVDRQDNLILIGKTDTTDFPTTAGSFQQTPPTQARHGFVSKLNMTTAAPSVCLDSWSVSFGSVLVKQSNTQIVHLTNCGNAPLHLGSLVSSTSVVTAMNGCGTIQAGSVCPLSIKFTPKDSSLVGGTLTLNDDTVISPQVIAFSGQGVAPQLSPSSESVPFGHLLVNTTGAGNPLFFQNIGNAVLHISSVSVNGDFAVNGNSCKGAIQPGFFCIATVAFSPIAAGIRTGTLTITSDDPVYPAAGMSLNGSGDSVYAAPIITSLGSPTAQTKSGVITVQVTGSNFYPASVIVAGGKAQATTYTNGPTLKATLNSSLSGTIGELMVSVTNPAPGGGSSPGIPLTRYSQVDLGANFVTSVPGSKLLYVSVSSVSAVNPNTVIPMNPMNGAKGNPIPVGQNPGLLAPSDDGAYLFVALNQDQTVQRINLSTQVVDRTFPFPPDNCTFCGPQSVADLRAVPGVSQEVVLALGREVALYNDSGLVNYVPTTFTAFGNFSSFAYASNPVTIYTLPITNAATSFLNVITVDAQGLHFTLPQSYGVNTTTGAQVVSDGTLLYTSAGEVWSPATQTQVGSFPVTTYNSTSYPNLHNLLLDSPTGHIFLIGDQPYGQGSSALVVSAYDQKTLTLSGTLAFPQIGDPLVNGLVRWGTNGFAFLGQGSTFGTQAVYSLTSSIAKSTTSNPVPKLTSLAPSSLPQGSFDSQVTLNGQGFAARSVVNWNGTPLQTTYVAKSVLTAIVPSVDLAKSGTAAMTVTNPAPGGGTSNVVSFTVASPTPMISFSSSTLLFGTQKVGTSSPAQTVAVQNPGTALLTISAIKVTGPNASSFHATSQCGSSLAPGANCSVSVVFKPTATGPFSASLAFTDNASGSPQTVSLSGTGN